MDNITNNFNNSNINDIDTTDTINIIVDVEDDVEDVVEDNVEDNVEDDVEENVEDDVENDVEDDVEENINNSMNNNLMNNHFIHIPINEQVMNMEIENKHNEIMDWSYINMTNMNDEIIEFINMCYLKNLQYDDEPIDTIIYTIRTAFEEGIRYELKDIVTNIFSYAMYGTNFIFNENFQVLNEILSTELKRLLRRLYTINILSSVLLNNMNHGQFEDVKLTLSEEELNKIPVSTYKNISQDLKEKNTNCTICRDEYRDNDEVRILQCEHVFHTDCVDNWLKNHSYKCPCCRKEAGTYKPNI